MKKLLAIVLLSAPGLAYAAPTAESVFGKPHAAIKTDPYGQTVHYIDAWKHVPGNNQNKRIAVDDISAIEPPAHGGGALSIALKSGEKVSAERLTLLGSSSAVGNRAQNLSAFDSRFQALTPSERQARAVQNRQSLLQRVAANASRPYFDVVETGANKYSTVRAADIKDMWVNPSESSVSHPTITLRLKNGSELSTTSVSHYSEGSVLPDPFAWGLRN